MVDRETDIESKSSENNNSLEDQYIFAGPLNISKSKRQASTVMGIDITLGENDYEALVFLVTREGAFVTFQQIYEAAWGNSETTDSIDHSYAALDNLVQQINKAGEGFMWVEYASGQGYRFMTHWGYNWRTQEILRINKLDSLQSYDGDANEIDIEEDTQEPVIKLSFGTILAGTGVLAAAAILVLLMLYSVGIISPTTAEPLHMDINVEDTVVPLAESPIIED